MIRLTNRYVRFCFSAIRIRIYLVYLDFIGTTKAREAGLWMWSVLSKCARIKNQIESISINFTKINRIHPRQEASLGPDQVARLYVHTINSMVGFEVRRKPYKSKPLERS